MVCVKLLKPCLAHSEQQVHVGGVVSCQALDLHSVDLKISI